MFNPLDPNPAVAARAVFPQSGRSRPEKQPFCVPKYILNFPIFVNFLEHVLSQKM